MVKCVKCGTAWTSSGLPFCPVCGAGVEEPVASSTPSKAASATAYAASDGSARKPSNGSAVLEAPPEIRKPESRIPAQAPVPAPVLEPTFDAGEFTRLEGVEPAVVIAPRSASTPNLGEARPMPEAPVEARKPETRIFRISEAIDASAILPAQTGKQDLPAPARPLNGPLILGILAFVPALLLPLTLAFENTRVLGILGFCMSGFFVPFAPIAWISGLSAEKRRRAQGIRPERRVSIGRLLGQGATLILVAEITLALIGIAVLRLSGSFPSTFWSSR